MPKLDHFHGEKYLTQAELREEWVVDGQSDVHIQVAGGVDPSRGLAKLIVNGQSRVRCGIPIIQLGLVDGQSLLNLGTVSHVVDKIDGQSTVRIAGGPQEFQGKIDGQSNVFVDYVDAVVFRDKIDGNCTIEFKEARVITGGLLAGGSEFYCPQHTEVHFDEVSWGAEIFRNRP